MGVVSTPNAGAAFFTAGAGPRCSMAIVEGSCPMLVVGAPRASPITADGMGVEVGNNHIEHPPLAC